jgi:hypothetical protein
MSDGPDDNGDFQVRTASLWQYWGPAGWWTQWYFPEGVHGKVWNLLHGGGWAVG